MNTSRSFSDVVSALGGPPGIAAICCVSKNTAASWVRRRSLPLRIWPMLIRSDCGQSVGLSNDEMVSIHLVTEEKAA